MHMIFLYKRYATCIKHGKVIIIEPTASSTSYFYTVSNIRWDKLSGKLVTNVDWDEILRYQNFSLDNTLLLNLCGFVACSKHTRIEPPLKLVCMHFYSDVVEGNKVLRNGMKAKKLCTPNTCNVWVIGAHRYEKGRGYILRMVLSNRNSIRKLYGKNKT